jgi:fermentation-respiration switch protein FrsA (DUF1100 family)
MKSGSFGRKTSILFGAVGAPLLFFAAVWMAGSFLSKPVNHPVGALPEYLSGRSVEFASESGSTIRGWLIPGRSGGGAIVLMHGYRGDRNQMLGRAPFLNRAGYTALLFDFQAHGESAGQRVTAGYLESRDAWASVEFVRRNLPGERVGLIGLSMGGAASLLASPPLDADAMVLELVYTDIERATANRLERILGRWARGFAPLLTGQIPLRLGIDESALRPIDRAGSVKAPKLFIAGAEDRHTKLAESRELFNAAAEPKEFWVIEGAAHIDAHQFAKDQYERRILDFFEKNLRK